MNICIDCRLYGLEHAGIGRYTMNLVSALKKLYPQDHFTLITNPIPHYSLAEQLRLPRILNQAHAGLYHFPHFNVPLLFNRPFVVTIHDLLWHEVKDPRATALSPLKHKLKYWGYQQVVKHAVFASKCIIVPSNYVKTQILTHYPAINPAKINVIYEGVDPALNPEGDPGSVSRLRRDPGSDNESYLLYVGSLYPHKNLEFIISALNHYNHMTIKPLPLHIVSSRSIFQKQLQAQVMSWGLSDNVVFTGPLTDSELAVEIRHAAALIQPSLSEGFGLTGLEAMALGTPVLSSTAGSLPEVYGDAALYFDPHDPADFLKNLETLPQKRAQLIAAGRAQVKKYSWGLAAKETFRLYENCLGL